MVRQQLDDRQWRKVEVVLRAEQGAGRHGRDDRKFVEAVLWWRRTGVPWRDLPAEFGPCKTVFNRFDSWAKRGKWKRLCEALQTDRDDDWHSLDSRVNRAHQHAAGAKGASWPGTRSFSRRAVNSEIECTFNLLKQARRFATRYENTLRNYAAVVAFRCALLWLRI
jgi:transposase